MTTTDNIDRRLLDERNRNNPSYWAERIDDYDDEHLFNNWQQIVFDFDLSPICLEHVFRRLRSRFGVTLSAIRAEYHAFLRDNGADGVMLSHIEWANEWIGNAPPLFYDDGNVWIFDSETMIYEPFDSERLLLRVAQDCTGPGAQKVSDSKAISRLIVSTLKESESDGSIPPLGFAANGKFYGFDDAGELMVEPLQIHHRARFQYPVEPDEFRPGLFRDMIEYALDGEQQALLAEHLGAALLGVGWRYQKALLWYGRGATGKSTLQNIVRAMIPQRLVSSVLPHQWEHEYYAAAMASAVVNLVGEIEDRKALGAAFKNVIGGGLIQARHPTHQPFSYVSRATHIFCTNRLPPTTDRSDAFWRRWSMIEFQHIVPESERDPFLAEKIIANEFDSVLAFAVDGAQRLIARGNYATTETERRQAAEWALTTDSILAFLSDPEWVVADHNSHVNKRELYTAYRDFCAENGMMPLSSWRIKHEIETSPQIIEMGIVERRNATGTRCYSGVRLRQQSSF